jgi:hypothetical protein
MNPATVITSTPERRSSIYVLFSRCFGELPIQPCFWWSVSDVGRRSALRNRVLFREAGLQILEVYRNAGLRTFRGSPEILDRPGNWLP